MKLLPEGELIKAFQNLCADFPCGPVAEILFSQSTGLGFDPVGELNHTCLNMGSHAATKTEHSQIVIYIYLKVVC